MRIHNKIEDWECKNGTYLIPTCIHKDCRMYFKMKVRRTYGGFVASKVSQICLMCSNFNRLDYYVQKEDK